MRLIDADAVIEKCGDWYVEEGSEEGFIGTLKSLIDEQLTVDAAPVVHGRWLVKCKAVDGSLSECSVCHDWQVHNGEYIPKYCPECGAKMDGDGNAAT